MIVYKWSITGVVIVDGILVAVKYWCQAADGHNVVETEGNWTMRTQYPIFGDTEEEQVVQWLDVDAVQSGKHLIKYRLQEQLDSLRSPPLTKAPWAVDTFKVTI